MKKIKVKFPKGIRSVHIPFMAKIGSYEHLYKEIQKVDVPKNARYIKAQHVVHIDLKDGSTNYQITEVIVEK